MKKFIFAALLSTSALAFAAGAHAEGDAAINSNTNTNTDVSAGNATPDNSYAKGAVEVDGNSISATSSTGTPDGTASGTINADGSASGVVGTKDGDDEATAATRAEDRANVNADLSTKTGVMKTRAKGAMGMLNPSEIKQVQSNLKEAGYNVRADGVWGPHTRAALKEYQKSKNLNVSGKMDAETRSSMGFTPNTPVDGGKGVDAGGAADMGNQ